MKEQAVNPDNKATTALTRLRCLSKDPSRGRAGLPPPLARLTMRPYPVERAMTANALHHPTRLPLATSGCQALRNGAGALQTWMFYSVQL